jgi:hypothetical protein
VTRLLFDWGILRSDMYNKGIESITRRGKYNVCQWNYVSASLIDGADFAEEAREEREEVRCEGEKKEERSCEGDNGRVAGARLAFEPKARVISPLWADRGCGTRLEDGDAWTIDSIALGVLSIQMEPDL